MYCTSNMSGAKSCIDKLQLIMQAKTAATAAGDDSVQSSVIVTMLIVATMSTTKTINHEPLLVVFCLLSGVSDLDITAVADCSWKEVRHFCCEVHVLSRGTGQMPDDRLHPIQPDPIPSCKRLLIIGSKKKRLHRPVCSYPY